MNRLLTLLLGTWLLTRSAQAQDTIPLYSDAMARQRAALMATRRPYIGLDLARGLWWVYSARTAAPPAAYYRPVALILYWPTRAADERNKSLYVSVGYAAYGGTLQRNIYQTGGSAHVRAGVERSRNGLLMGAGGLVAGWSGQGSFVFRGPAFGDYQQSIGQLSGTLVGLEGHLGGEVPLGRRLVLRMLARATMFARTSNEYNLPPPYLSGLDAFTPRPVGLAGSFSANLLFRL